MSSVGSALMTFASTAAFVLPEPVGALASGAISTINMLFGESNGTEQAIRDALTQALKDFQTQQYADTIKVQTNIISSAANWLDTNMTTLTDAGDMDTAHSFAQLVLAQVETVDSPCSTLLNALTTLNDSTLLNDPTVGSEAYTSLKFGIGLYLTYLRLAVQMQSWLDANQAGKEADLDYGLFDNFRLTTEQWCATVASIINAYETARLNQIGPVEENFESEVYPCTKYNFKDSGTRPANAGPAPTGPNSGWAGTNAPDQTQASNQRTLYVTLNVGTALALEYGPDQQAIAAWMDNLQTWEQSILPKVPQQPPELVAGGWGAATPQGANWVNGATVQYSVAYANAKGESAIGPSCDPIPITAQAFPTLTVPVDPMQLASTRHIHRQFAGGASDVFIITDNTTSTWQDNNP